MPADPGAADEIAFRQLRRDAEYFDVDVSSEVLEDLLGVSSETIRKLAAKDVVVRVARGRFALRESLKRYAESLRETAAGRGGDDDQAIQARENALLARSRREAQDLKNEQTRGELVSVSEVRTTWASEWLAIRNTLLSVPGRVSTRLPHLTRHDLNEIDHAIRKVLSEFGNDLGNA